MLKLLKGMIVGLMIIGFTGCVSTSDIKVESAKSDKVDLKGYKTYAIVEGSGVAGESKKSTHDIDAELNRIIHNELGKKGKVPVTKDPDFYVAYLAAKDMEAIEINIDEEGQETIKETPAAAMLLLLIDGETGVLIGISTAEGEAKDLPLEDRKKRLEYTIKKMFNEL